MLTFYWASLPYRNSRESIIETGNSEHRAAKGIFLRVFHHQSKHFHAYFRLHEPNHSDLGIIGDISFSDANFGQRWWRQKWTKGQLSSRSAQASMGPSSLAAILEFRFIKNRLNCEQKVESPDFHLRLAYNFSFFTSADALTKIYRFSPA